jgi:hypothetical protein
MVVLDWILLALVGGFVATAALASVLDRRRTQASLVRAPAVPTERGLWSVAEAVWAGARPPRGLRSSSGRPLRGRPAVRPWPDVDPCRETRFHVAGHRFAVRHPEPGDPRPTRRA